MQRNNQLLSILNTALNSSGLDNNKGEIVYHCPFCNHHKKKLSVNVAEGKWHCWVCDAKGASIFTLLKKVKAPKDLFTSASKLFSQRTFKSTDSQEKQIELPKEFRSLTNVVDSIAYRQAKSYLLKRKVTPEDIIRYNIGYCVDGDYGGRVIVPSYDMYGALNYFIARSFYNSPLKYKNPPVAKNTIVFELFVNWNLPIILCEGVFDAIAIKRNAIPLLGKTVQDKLLEKLICNNVSEVIVCLDSDALDTSYKVCRQLMSYDINVSKVIIKDGDPADLGYLEMRKQILNKSRVSDLSILKEKLSI